MSWYEYLSLIITGVGVFVGIGVLWVYYRQLQAMNATVEKTALAADAAKQSAEAATNALNMANRPKLMFVMLSSMGLAKTDKSATI